MYDGWSNISQIYRILNCLFNSYYLYFIIKIIYLEEYKFNKNSHYMEFGLGKSLKP